MLGMTNYLTNCFYLWGVGYVGKKVLDLQCGFKSWEILIVIMTSNDENVPSCKRHTVVRRTFCLWRSLCPFLALRLTTVSLDITTKGFAFRAIYQSSQANNIIIPWSIRCHLIAPYLSICQTGTCITSFHQSEQLFWCWQKVDHFNFASNIWWNLFIQID